MSFDKVKAMREAERFLAQGKIRAAISEYKRVVEFDKTDFNTLNMLGDLYVKASESDEAVKCFTQVAEHYSKQGFAQKAIAIYNKISRLNPDSIEVAAKLAQLYQMKGSFAEARTHYTTVAEQYTKNGKKAEALSVWKQIANLDPNNTDIYLKIADACWQDQQKEEAANAYIEAGNRLSNKSQFESAITAFSRALEIRPDDLPALRGYAKSQVQLGYADEAAKALESSYARQPHSREIINLLADCYIEAEKLADAETTIVKLVEQEPTQYPKLLEIFQAYLRERDVTSAARMLTMASEHLLVGGRAVELEQKINEIFSLNPEDLDGIRLLVRFHSWQRDEAGIKNSFERLAEAAKQNNAVEDEIYALTQLVMISPQNVYFAQRLQELNLASGAGFYQTPQSDSQLNGDIPTFESYQGLSDEDSFAANETGFALYEAREETEINELDSENTIEVSEDSIVDEDQSDIAEAEEEYQGLSEFEKHALQNEIEGIDFYIEQGFWDLAEKTLDEIETQYGIQPKINKLRELINSAKNQVSNEETDFQEDYQSENQETDSQEVYENDVITEETEDFSIENSEIENETTETEQSFIEESTVEDEVNELAETESGFESSETENTNSLEEVETAEFSDPENEENETFVEEDEGEAVENEAEEISVSPDFAETLETLESETVQNEELTEDYQAEFENQVVAETADSPAEAPQINPFEALKSELTVSEAVSKSNFAEENYDDDFETSYQTGIVYREMGLIEDSIREFQDAIKRVTPQDGTRRFFLCCNMLGLCFMEKQMPTIAIMWLKQGLESNHLTGFELNGMRYELANAYESAGDKQKAQQIFEEIYAVDVSFRDVGSRLQTLLAA